jgi:hypothetical protein
VDEARKRELVGPEPAAYRRLRLAELGADSGLREGDRGSQPVRTCPDHDGVGDALPLWSRMLRS